MIPNAAEVPRADLEDGQGERPFLTVQDGHHVRRLTSLVWFLTNEDMLFPMWEHIRYLVLFKLGKMYVELPSLLELQTLLKELPNRAELWDEEQIEVQDMYPEEWERMNYLWEKFVQAYRRRRDEWKSIPAQTRRAALDQLARSPELDPQLRRLIERAKLPELPQLSLPHPGVVGEGGMTKKTFGKAVSDIRAWMKHQREPAKTSWNML